MGGEQLIRVHIETGAEMFPEVAIYEADRPDDTVEQAEKAVLQYVAEHFPEVRAIRLRLEAENDA